MNVISQKFDLCSQFLCNTLFKFQLQFQTQTFVPLWKERALRRPCLADNRQLGFKIVSIVLIRTLSGGQKCKFPYRFSCKKNRKQKVYCLVKQIQMLKPFGLRSWIFFRKAPLAFYKLSNLVFQARKLSSLVKTDRDAGGKVGQGGQRRTQGYSEPMTMEANIKLGGSGLLPRKNSRGQTL